MHPCGRRRREAHSRGQAERHGQGASRHALGGRRRRRPRLNLDLVNSQQQAPIYL
jgi:hypothetical protein